MPVFHPKDDDMHKRTIIWSGVLALVVVMVAGLWLVLFQPMPGPVSQGQPSGIPTADPARLQAHVKALAEEFSPRSPRDMQRLNAAADYVHKEFTACGAQVEEQTFVVDGETHRNIIARFAPKGRTYDPPLVIGAHYDAVVTTPGADDNASGTAGVLELARMLAEHPPAVPVELVAWTLEEPPYFRGPDMGSAVYAGIAAESDRLPRLVIVLEMIGYFSDVPGSQLTPSSLLHLFYPERGDFLMVAGRLADTFDIRAVKAGLRRHTNLPIYALAAPPGLGGVDLSDHRNFWPYKVPAVMLTDTAFFRNTEYHKPGDTPDRLDYQRMAQVVQAVYGFIQEAR